MDKTVISVSGKGGTGKTTVVALILKVLTNHDRRSILVVDADPSTNIPDILGVSIRKTVGMIATELKKKTAERTIPPTISKRDLLEAWIMETLVEEQKYDLLAMGRTEGEGCYCMVNNLLTNILDTLSKNYDITLMDMEAGLEHLSRRTERDVDIMLVITDPSKMGLQTALRIKELAKEVHIAFKHMYLVGNRFQPEMGDMLERKAKEMNVELAGIIPTDSNVAKYSLEGKSLLKLPDDSPALLAMKTIIEKMGLMST